MLTTRQKQATKSPPKGRHQWRARSNFKFPTPIKGNGPTGSLRSSYHTAHRAVKKREAQGVRRTAKEIAIKGKIVSILSSVLHSWAPTGPKGHDTPDRMLTTRQKQATKAPQKIAFEEVIVQISSSRLQSRALAQRVACAAATPPPPGRCKKTTLKGKIVSISSSVLHSWAPTKRAHRPEGGEKKQYQKLGYQIVAFGLYRWTIRPFRPVFSRSATCFFQPPPKTY